jgi:hypothetical protein
MRNSLAARRHKTWKNRRRYRGLIVSRFEETVKQVTSNQFSTTYTFIDGSRFTVYKYKDKATYQD